MSEPQEEECRTLPSPSPVGSAAPRPGQGGLGGQHRHVEIHPSTLLAPATAVLVAADLADGCRRGRSSLCDRARQGTACSTPDRTVLGHRRLVFPWRPYRALYDRLARFHIGEEETLPSARHARLCTADVDTRSRPTCTRIIGWLRCGPTCWSPRPRGGTLQAGTQPLPASIQLPGCAPDRFEPTHDSPCAQQSLDVMGDGSLVLLPSPHTSGSVSLLIPAARSRCCWSATSAMGLTLARRFQGGLVANSPSHPEGAGFKQRCRLVILPAHDPTAAQRLLES